VDKAYFVYLRKWAQTELLVAVFLELVIWMIFMDSMGLGTQISLQLSGAEHQVIEVRSGKTFSCVGKGKYFIRAGYRADYDAFLADVGKRVKSPTKFIYLWSIVDDFMRLVDEILELSFFSPLYL